MDSFDLDKILQSLGGWGKFQTVNYIVLSSVVMFSCFPMSFIFVARDTKYRCFIEACDSFEKPKYETEWLENAVPFIHQQPSRCLHYRPKNNSCNFSRNETLTCQEFVFEIDQTTIVQDFNITCEENIWKLTIAGSVNELGELICLPFAGFLSDRFGRKFMVVISVFLTSVVGLVRSFSAYYYQYLTLEFLDTALGSGMYSGSFILAMEIVDSKNRNFGNTIINAAFMLGLVFLGLAAWITPTWRVMLQILYTPGIFIATIMYFTTPESIRWLISKNRQQEAYAVLKRTSKLNTNKLDKSALEELENLNNSQNAEPKEQNSSIFSVLKNKSLLIRLVHCSFTWISCTFPYYGLTIQSVSLSENIYLDFILCVLIELPAVILTQKLMEKIGRKKTLAFSLILAAISCLSVNLISKEWSTFALILFTSGKFFITISYTDIYIYTAEMFPTKSRHSCVGICVMFSRIGSMVAPQVPLLTRVFAALPSLIFAALTFTSGILAFWFPETLTTRLPDEISEAVNI